jgi:DNA-binding GntR family transcriptional regulator
MSKKSIASACALATLVAGCGKDTAAERKTACAKAGTAMKAYHAAGTRVGLDFFNRAGEEQVIAAAAAFRARLKHLVPLTSATQREQVQELGRTLELHEELLTALAAHNVALAHKLATPAFEEALNNGQKNFRTICKLPPEA